MNPNDANAPRVPSQIRTNGPVMRPGVPGSRCHTKTMRLALLAAIPAVALALLGGASAAEPVRVPSHCSKSGDVCYWIVEAGTAHNLRLTLAAKYFSRYRICVRPQRRAATCKSFPVKRAGAQWGGKVSWQRNFPNAPGRYRVTWMQGNESPRPAAELHLPLPTDGRAAVLPWLQASAPSPRLGRQHEDRGAMASEARQERLARNESLFREVNERIESARRSSARCSPSSCASAPMTRVSSTCR